MDVTAKIGADRLLPVVVLHDAAAAVPLLAALRSGGLHCVEITFRTAAAVDAIRAATAAPGPDGGDMVVGAGTVLTAGQVDQAVEAGARFVVSPGFDAAVVARCARHGVPVFPGVGTATEIMMALAAGVDTVKVFPAAQLGGAALVKALAAPFPGVRFIPTGGITAGNAGQYLELPAVLAVGGTWMVPAGALARGDWDEVTRLTTEAVEAARAR